MSRKFRKRPVEVEAVQLRWDTWGEICAFAGVGKLEDGGPEGCFLDRSGREIDNPLGYLVNGQLALKIPTLEGVMLAREGDWVIRGVKSELYPCKPAIFDMTYDPVSPGAEEMAELPFCEAALIKPLEREPVLGVVNVFVHDDGQRVTLFVAGIAVATWSYTEFGRSGALRAADRAAQEWHDRLWKLLGKFDGMKEKLEASQSEVAALREEKQRLASSKTDMNGPLYWMARALDAEAHADRLASGNAALWPAPAVTGEMAAPLEDLRAASEKAWKDAAASLEAKGEDVDALLREAGENIDRERARTEVVEAARAYVPRMQSLSDASSASREEKIARANETMSVWMRLANAVHAYAEDQLSPKTSQGASEAAALPTDDASPAADHAAPAGAPPEVRIEDDGTRTDHEVNRWRVLIGANTVVMGLSKVHAESTRDRIEAAVAHYWPTPAAAGETAARALSELRVFLRSLAEERDWCAACGKGSDTGKRPHRADCVLNTPLVRAFLENAPRAETIKEAGMSLSARVVEAAAELVEAYEHVPSSDDVDCARAARAESALKTAVRAHQAAQKTSGEEPGKEQETCDSVTSSSRARTERTDFSAVAATSGSGPATASKGADAARDAATTTSVQTAATRHASSGLTEAATSTPASAGCTTCLNERAKSECVCSLWTCRACGTGWRGASGSTCPTCARNPYHDRASQSARVVSREDALAWAQGGEPAPEGLLAGTPVRAENEEECLAVPWQHMPVSEAEAHRCTLTMHHKADHWCARTGYTWPGATTIVKPARVEAGGGLVRVVERDERAQCISIGGIVIGWWTGDARPEDVDAALSRHVAVETRKAKAEMMEKVLRILDARARGYVEEAEEAEAHQDEHAARAARYEANALWRCKTLLRRETGAFSLTDKMGSET